MAKSRPQRWSKAVADAKRALEDVRTHLEELSDLQGEYIDWRDNIPENQQSGATAEKLDGVIGLDFEGCVKELESVLYEAESIDLPRGFGQD